VRLTTRPWRAHDVSMLSYGPGPAGPGGTPGPANTRQPTDPPVQPERWAGLAADDDLEQDISGWLRRRQVIVGALVCASTITPAVATVAGQGFTGKALFLFPASLIFVAAVVRVFVNPEGWEKVPHRSVWIALIAGVGTALFAAGGMNWFVALAIVAAVFGNLAVKNSR
jgi:hypothetical protein